MLSDACAPPPPGSAGVLFDAAQGPLGPVAASVNLAAPGPRLMPRLWSCILEAITCIDAGQARGAALLLRSDGALHGG